MENRVYGTFDDDFLKGTKEADNIQGLEGNDTILGSLGMDYIWGDSGDDVIVYRPRHLRVDHFDFVVSGGKGVDTLRLHAEGAAHFSLSELGDMGGLSELEVLQFYGTESGTRVEVTANNWVFKSMAVRNSFEGAVVVSGSTEAEVDDVLILRASVYQNVNADFSSLVFQNWGAEDQVRVEVYSVANPGSAYVKTTHVSDLVIGGQWDDLVKGNRGDDRILGMDGNDKLRGESGADSLVGGAGRDKLWGGNGRDTLEGGTQNDRLVGGRGNDQLTGGSGADVFIFNDGDGRDTILDFGQGNDRLRLDEDIWGGGLEPEQLLDQYARVVNGNTLLEFDDQLIRLRGVTDPAALVDDISFF